MQPHTHTHTWTHTSLILSAVIVRPHARCVSTQELTAWEASYKRWDGLQKSFLERVSLLTSLTYMQNYTFMHGGVLKHKHTHICTHTQDVLQAWPAVSEFQRYPQKAYNCYFCFTFWYYTDQHTQLKKKVFLLKVASGECGARLTQIPARTICLLAM